MTRFARLLIAIACVAAGTSSFTLGPVSAQEKPAPKPAPASITGKWAATLEMSAFTATVTLEFKQDGEKIAGTYTGRYGAFPFTGTVKDRALAFAFTMKAENTDVEMSFSGEVAADAKTIKGRLTMSELGDGAWSAVRAPEK
jgi:hypothetical protein